MCIGIPGRICHIAGDMQARVDVCGVVRAVDLTLVGTHDERGVSRMGQCVLVHVGFAKSVIDEAEALDTLAALQHMYELEPDVGPLLFGEEVPDALR